MSAPGPEKVAMTTQEYAAEWSKRSDKHVADEDYPWMVAQMPPSKTILEIGCGSGRATWEMVKAGRNIIAIEINDDLVLQATAYLQDKGVKVASLWAKVSSDGQPLDGGLFSDHPVLIISANFFRKNAESLLENAGIEGIVCWLIGAAPDHIAEMFGTSAVPPDGEPLEAFTAQRAARYRENAHIRCGDLGRSLLQEGGFVHFVDRCHPSILNEGEAIKDDLAKDYEDILKSPFSIRMQDVQFRAPGSSATDSKMTYVSAASRSTVSGDNILMSIVATRRSRDKGLYR